MPQQTQTGTPIPRLITRALALSTTLIITACADPGEKAVNEAIQDLNVIDDSNLSQLFLTASSPEEAIDYFSRSLKDKPDRLDLRRGLAKSYIRAKRTDQAALAWRAVVEHPQSNHSDAVALAEAYIRSNQWDKAVTTLNAIPPTYETYDRYRLEAIIADSQNKWDKADSFYETAAGLTTTPAKIYNNWGYSKLSRGKLRDAERLFSDALRHDSTLFTAKNNLVLARGAQRKYTLPVVDMTQIERARLLHTLALTAIKQNDVTMGKGLLSEAIDTHPQHFEEATRALRALERNVRP